jgi:ribosomal protein S1
MVEGLMHVSETPLGRGEKPQEHFKEGDTVRARILRIEDADMKVGLTGLNLEEAAAAPVAVAEEAAAPAAEAPAATEEAAPKKKRTRKKTDEAPKE